MNNYRNFFNLEGRVAIVTGGAGLIGREIAKGLCDLGATVYIADLKVGNTLETIDNQNARFVSLDITSETSVENAVAHLMNESGRIDILVNSAYPRTSDWGIKFEKVPFSSWKENIDNQLGGYFLCCQKVAEQMKAQEYGSIINIGSIYGSVAPDFSVYEGTEMTMPVAYSAIKGGIIALTRYIATYYGSFNIRANVVSPGGIIDRQPQTFIDKYNYKTPLGRMGTPMDVAGAVLFLASDASAYITGQNFLVDGGWTAW
jgi:NAD(P)-dependent dehydrogenase (short-subunit alcohol dehydrogenase family)